MHKKYGSETNKERLVVGFLCSGPCFREQLFKLCLDEKLGLLLFLGLDSRIMHF